MIKISTDGACKGNPGRGGWGVFVHKNENHEEVEVYGSNPYTTNNQMELKAAIIGAKFIPEGGEGEITTDSQYVKNGITVWIHGWKQNGWKTSKKEPVKNAELWKELDSAISGKKVTWQWILGHNNDYGNERADFLANKGARGESNEESLFELISHTTGVKPRMLMDIQLLEEQNIITGLYLQKKDSEMYYAVLESKTTLWNCPTQLYNIVNLQNYNEVYAISYKQLYDNFIPKSENNKLNKLFFHYLKINDSNLYYEKRKECKHIVIQKNESAVCDICEDHFGWHCPESPDHTCHYYTNRDTGKIELLDGTVVDVPNPDHDPHYETDDFCLFCHAPEERR